MKKEKLKTAIIVSAVLLLATIIAFIVKTAVELLSYDGAQTSFPAYTILLFNFVYFFIPIVFESIIFAVLLYRKKVLSKNQLS